MNKPITVEQLKRLCDQEIKKGNGKKVIMISSDDEGNNYHYLWYAFTSIESFEEPMHYKGIDFPGVEFDYCEESIASKKNTIILG